jgi:hypothetical protein
MVSQGSWSKCSERDDLVASSARSLAGVAVLAVGFSLDFAREYVERTGGLVGSSCQVYRGAGVAKPELGELSERDRVQADQAGSLAVQFSAEFAA